MRSRLLLAVGIVLALQGGAFAMGAKSASASYVAKLEQEGALSRCGSKDEICSIKAEELAKAARLMDAEGIRNFSQCPADERSYGSMPEAPAVARWIAKNARSFYRVTREGWRPVADEDADHLAEAVKRMGSKEGVMELDVHVYVSPKVYEEMESVKDEIRAEMEANSRMDPAERLLRQFGGFRFEGY